MKLCQCGSLQHRGVSVPGPWILCPEGGEVKIQPERGERHGPEQVHEQRASSAPEHVRRHRHLTGRRPLMMEILPASTKTDMRTFCFELLLKLERDSLTRRALEWRPSVWGFICWRSFQNKPVLISSAGTAGPGSPRLTRRALLNQIGLWKNWYGDCRDNHCLKLELL